MAAASTVRMRREELRHRAASAHVRVRVSRLATVGMDERLRLPPHCLAADVRLGCKLSAKPRLWLGLLVASEHTLLRPFRAEG
jgi:hypothetical protein